MGYLLNSQSRLVQAMAWSRLRSSAPESSPASLNLSKAKFHSSRSPSAMAVQYTAKRRLGGMLVGKRYKADKYIMVTSLLRKHEIKFCCYPILVHQFSTKFNTWHICREISNIMLWSLYYITVYKSIIFHWTWVRRRHNIDACRIIGPLWGESIDHRRFSSTRGGGLKWSWLLSWTSYWTYSPVAGDLKHHDAQMIQHTYTHTYSELPLLVCIGVIHPIFVLLHCVINTRWQTKVTSVL